MLEQNATAGLSRGQFLKKMGLNGASLMAFYCIGTTMSSCTKKDEPTPNNPNTGGNGNGNTKIDFTLDLNSNDFKALKTDGEFVIKDSIIIVNSADKFVALAKACTHEGTTVNFRKATADFRCPNHGAEFNLDGTVKKSPAPSALKVYKTELLDSNNKLRVFE
jgi:cytochrome b6-f complex iron-sulfur subunit